MRRAVVDQPGLKFLLFGVLTALFLGLLLRSQIRPWMIEQKLRQSTLKIEKDFKIDFESAEIRLSEWGIPRPMLYVHGVRLSPQKEACQDSQIYIEDVSFPINLSLLLSEKKIISSLHLSLVEIRSSQIAECFKEIQESIKSESVSETSDATNVSAAKVFQAKADIKKENVEAISISVAKGASVTITKNAAPDQNNILSSDQKITEAKKPRSLLKEVRIDKLKWISLDHVQSNFDLTALQINLDYNNENHVSHINIQSQLHAFRDNQKNFNLLKSEIRISSDIENKQFDLNTEITGFLIDRPFKFKLKKDLLSYVVNFYGELNQVPLKTMNYILNQQMSEIKIFDALSGTSLNASFFGQYDFLKHQSSLSLSNLRLNTPEKGSIESSDVRVSLSDVLKVEPFELHINQISLTPFLNLKYFEKIKPSILSAGTISGLVQVDNFENFKIKTLVENTSFIFANRGVRVGQEVDSFNLSVQLKKTKLQVMLNDFILDSKKLFGFIKYNQDFETNRKELNLQLEGNILKPETVQLFTGIQYNPNLKVQLNSDLNGRVMADGSISIFKYDQLSLQDIKFKFVKNLNEKNLPLENLQVQAKAAQVDKNIKSNLKLFSLLPDDVFEKGILRTQQINLLFKKVYLQGGSFNLTTNFEKINFGKNILVNGLFDKNNNINGDFIIKGKRNNFNYKISGNADKDILLIQK